jgi:hypothetical protein
MLILGCSGNTTTPTSPSSTADDLPFIAAMDITDAPGHRLSGYWGISIDVEKLTATVEPIRDITTHYNLTSMLPPNVTINSYIPSTGILDADIMLRNPYGPPSPIDGYDIRGIIFTDSGGASLTNADDWTSLFDIPGGSFMNPFKAYAKTQTNRIFAGGAWHNENYLIHFPSAPYYVTFGVDGCHPGNCDEPYLIDNFAHGALFDVVDSIASVDVDVFDWQNDVDNVAIVAPAITGESATYLAYNTGNTWSMTLTNNTGAAAGDYSTILGASSTNSGSLYLYDVVNIHIDQSTLVVSSISGGSTINEGSCTSYSVTASGDTGITYSWTCIPASGGTFSAPNAATTNFCANNVSQDTQVTLQLDVSSDNYGTVRKSTVITVLNIYGGWPNCWGAAWFDEGKSVITDSNGNIYVGGYFWDTVDFDPGPATVNRTATEEGDCFLSKFDSTGHFQWVQVWGGGKRDTVHSVAVDHQDNVYAAGEYGDYTINDMFLYKFNANGTTAWTFDWSTSTTNASIQDVIYDGSDGVYLVGGFGGTMDFDPNPAGIDFQTANNAFPGSYDVFIISLRFNGQYHWGRHWGGIFNDYGYDAAINSNNDIYVTGYCNWGVPSPIYDACLLKYNSSGTKLYEEDWGGTLNDVFGNGVVVTGTGTAERVYVGGSFSGSSVDFNPDPSEYAYESSNGMDDAYLVKFKSDLDFEWVKTWGGNTWDVTWDLAADSSGNVYSAGLFWTTVDFDPSSGTVIHTSNDRSDAFVSKFDPSGNFQWVSVWGGNSDDENLDIAFDSSNNLYLTGYFYFGCDFDPGTGTEWRTSNGMDVFLTKLDLNGNLVRN